jgi:alkylation response protein AidB-like acyl-CoA dehydrogenase
VRYATERSQFGSLVANFQGIQFMLAEMATKLEAARLLVYKACSLLDAGGPGTSKASAMAKWFASDTAMQVTTDAVQVLGGVGYVRDFPVERMMRDAKATQLYEGTNQVQRIVIARRLLEEITGTP